MPSPNGNILRCDSGLAQAGYNLVDDRPGGTNTPEEALAAERRLVEGVGGFVVAGDVMVERAEDQDDTLRLALWTDGGQLVKEAEIELVGDTWYLTSWVECFDGPVGPDVDLLDNSTGVRP